MEEVWKSIKGYEGFYEISNLGRLRSVERVVKHERLGFIKRKSILQKKRKDGKGYCQARLQKDGVSTYPKIHRLVADHFLDNPLNLPQVNHLDENKENNCVSNLEWCTAQRNVEYSHSKIYTLQNIDTGEVIEVFNLNKWCKEIGLHSSLLCKTVTGERNHHARWKIVKKQDSEG